MINLRVGVIRVFTSEDQEIIDSHGSIISDLYGFECINECIPNQPKGIYNDDSEDIAIPKIIELAKKMEKLNQVDGIIISCAADPGLKEVRKAVNVPVASAGSSLAHLAKSISNNIGVLTIEGGVPRAMLEVLGDSLIASKKPDDINNTADLLKDGAIKKSLEAVYRLIDEGAEIIIFACTGYITIGLDQLLQEKHNIKVISPVTAEGNAMSVILRGV